MKYTNIYGIHVWQFNDIMRELGHPDCVVMNMYEFEEVFKYSTYDAILSAFYGGRVGHPQDSFNPNDKYFTYDGYDNLLSIPIHYIQEYMNRFESEILEYANDNEIKLCGVEVAEEGDQ